MVRWFVGFGVMLLTTSAFAQVPQAKFSYEDRSGTQGHTLVVNGKLFGSYREISGVYHSSSGKAGLFLATKRDKTYVIANGHEWGPLPAGWDIDQAWISDDEKVAGVLLYRYDDDDNESLKLWVNGQEYGPYTGINSFDYSETEGHWLSSVETSDDEGNSRASVLLDGNENGPFDSVEATWIHPDGRTWGWSGTDSEGMSTVVTKDATWSNVVEANVDQMDLRSEHWGMGLRLKDEDEVIEVDGVRYKNYLNFQGLIVTYSGHHWGFSAEKLSDSGDSLVVVIDGKEYPGEDLETSDMNGKEVFVWKIRDGARTSFQVLTLP